MKIEINVGKKHFYAFATLLLLAFSAMLAAGFGGTRPAVVGHSLGEIDWSQPLSSDLRVNGKLGIGKSAGVPLDVVGDIRASGMLSAGSVSAPSLCIGADCRSSWPGTASVEWNSIANMPAGFADGIDNITSGAAASVDWGSIIGVPAGFADGSDDGLTEDQVRQIVQDEVAGVGSVSCGSPIYDSMSMADDNGRTGIAYDDASYKYDRGKKEVPASCRSDSGCIIKQEVYDKNGLKLVRQYNYVQYASNKWWSTYQPSGQYTNGDSVYTKIVPPYGSSAGGYLLMLDDQYRSGAGNTNEKSPSQWTFADTTAGYGMKVSVCAELEE